MRWEAIDDKWFRFKRKAQLEWSALSEAELESVEGDRDRLAALVARRYDKSPDEARMAVSSWKDRVASI